MGSVFFHISKNFSYLVFQIEFDDLINPFKNMIEHLIHKNLRDEEALRSFLEEYVQIKKKTIIHFFYMHFL
jgi:hypothetical protein